MALIRKKAVAVCNCAFGYKIGYHLLLESLKSWVNKLIKNLKTSLWRLKHVIISITNSLNNRRLWSQK